MRLKFVCFPLSLMISLAVCFTAAAEESAEPVISAETAVLYCANNSEVIFEKDCDKRMKPASTTKIMTALLALEASSEYEREITFTAEMTAEGSSMYLNEGDTLTLRSLAQGMMLVSGNDSANAIAIGLEGSLEGFAQLMNSRARQLEMTGTHFMNPSGLDDENHYSTARDLAVLMSYAMENPDFAEITSQKSATVNFIEPYNKSVTYANHNKLLSMYRYCVGGKTGYTLSAGRCLVTAAEKDGIMLIAVTMNDKNDWNDHIAMFEYGFSQLELFTADDSSEVLEIPVTNAAGDLHVNLYSPFSVHAVIKAGERANVRRVVTAPKSLEAPVGIKLPYGRISYMLNGEEIAYSLLCADRSVGLYEPNLPSKIRKSLLEFFSGNEK